MQPLRLESQASAVFVSEDSLSEENEYLKNSIT